MKWFLLFFILFGILCQPALALDHVSTSVHQIAEADHEPADTPLPHEESEECENELETEDDFISERFEINLEPANLFNCDYGSRPYSPPHLDRLLPPPRA